MTVIARATVDLGRVVEYWPGLAELLDPAVHAPQQPSAVTPERRAELDYQARIERWERIDVAPGEHPDAARAEIIDLMTAIRSEAYEVADTIAWEVVRPPRLPRIDRQQTIDHHLELAILLLPNVTHDLTVHWVAGRAATMAALATRALALAYDGQALKVPCPYCKGGLSGGLCLRVRILPHGDVVIVCESDIPCEPPRRKVSTWWQGRPAWPFVDWTWLAKQLAQTSSRNNAA